jgi:MFS family permease
LQLQDERKEYNLKNIGTKYLWKEKVKHGTALGMKHIESPFSTYLIIFSGLIVVLGSLGFARFGYSMIAPGMRDELMLTYTQMGLIESGNFSGYLIFSIFGGILATKYGPKFVITLSLILVGTAMLLTGFINSFPQALLLRSLTGIGSGGANVPAMMLPVVWLSARRRGLGAGLIASGSGLGIIVTGFLVPKLTELFGGAGWRYSWIILGVLTLGFSLICSVTIKNRGEKNEHTQKHSEIMNLRQVATDPLLWKIGIIYFMFGISYIIYATFFGAYLVNEVQLSKVTAGGLWAIVGSFSIVSGPIWGHISDKIGRGYSLALVYVIQSIAYFLFTNHNIGYLYASAIMFGISAWGIATIVAAYSGDHFGTKYAFSALGFLTLIFGFGQVFGPTIAGYLIDMTQTFSTAFLLSSSAAIVGALLSLKLLRKSYTNG